MLLLIFLFPWRWRESWRIITRFLLPLVRHSDATNAQHAVVHVVPYLKRQQQQQHHLTSYAVVELLHSGIQWRSEQLHSVGPKINHVKIEQTAQVELATHDRRLVWVQKHFICLLQRRRRGPSPPDFTPSGACGADCQVVAESDARRNFPAFFPHLGT